jgi:hypothetical protein
VSRLAIRKTVDPAGLIRVGGDGGKEVDWRRPVISIANDESFGCARSIVGYARMTRVAAVLFMREDDGFSDFGCGTIGRKIGKVISLDSPPQL